MNDISKQQQVSDKAQSAKRLINTQAGKAKAVFAKSSPKQKLIVAVAASLITLNTAWSYFSGPGNYISRMHDAAVDSSTIISLEDVQAQIDTDTLHANLKAQVGMILATKMASGATPTQLASLAAMPQIEAMSERTASGMTNPESIYNLVSGHKYRYRASNPGAEPNSRITEQGHAGVGTYEAEVWDIKTNMKATMVMEYQWGTWRLTNITLPPELARLF